MTFPWKELSFLGVGQSHHSSCAPNSLAQGAPCSPRFRSGFRLAFRCCPWLTPTEEDKFELTPTPSLSTRVNRCHTKETLFMAGDAAPTEATCGEAGRPQDGSGLWFEYGLLVPTKTYVEI